MKDESRKAEGGRRKAEGGRRRRQKAEGRRQKAEGRGMRRRMRDAKTGCEDGCGWREVSGEELLGEGGVLNAEARRWRRLAEDGREGGAENSGGGFSPCREKRFRVQPDGEENGRSLNLADKGIPEDSSGMGKLSTPPLLRPCPSRLWRLARGQVVATSTDSTLERGSGMGSPSRKPSKWNSMASRMRVITSGQLSAAARQPGKSGT